MEATLLKRNTGTLYLCDSHMPSFIHKAVRLVFRRRHRSRTPAMDPEEMALLDEVKSYAVVLSQYIPYFNHLTDEQKERFIKRVYFFKSSKQFHFHELDEDEDKVKVLVSAAAVQLTFGLRKYLLSYFKDIHIVPDAYPIAGYQGLYIGHVQPRSIHLSWKHFLEGYKNDKDNINVAIHEMAHALEYDHFIHDSGIDPELRSDFEKFRTITGPSFVHILLGKPSYLRGYAYTNAREFWAVSVEAFFENPAELKAQMPELYRHVSEVLNQG